MRGGSHLPPPNLMTLKEIFDEIDSWSKVRVKNDRKCVFYNQVMNDICTTWDLLFMLHSDDTLATTSGTYKYDLSLINGANGDPARASAVRGVYNNLLPNHRIEHFPWHVEGNEIVFDNDPGTAVWYITCVHYPWPLTLKLYDDSIQANPALNFTTEIPPSNHAAIISGMKYFIENDIFGQATSAVAQQWALDKMNLISRFNGSRSTDRRRLSVNNYNILNNGERVNAF